MMDMGPPNLPESENALNVDKKRNTLLKISLPRHHKMKQQEALLPDSGIQHFKAAQFAENRTKNT